MASVGTKKNPAIVRVQTEERARRVLDFCEEHDIALIVGVEPDKPEDISDIEKAVLARTPTPATQKIGRNDPCHCGSGKKLKKCCVDQPQRLPA